MKQLRNGLRYLAIIVLDIFMMLLFHSYVNFVLLVGLLFFTVYSFYGLQKAYTSLKLEVKLPEDIMYKAEEFLVRFVMTNPTMFPLVNCTLKLEIENPFYAIEGTHYLNMPARAKKTTQVQYPIVMDYSGRFVITVKQIRIVDLLGIFERVIPCNIQKECMVFPVSEECGQEAGHIYINGVSESMESKEKGYDFSDISGIREYIPGDKLQNIHWKLSVKKDELMVKERVSVSAMQLNVLVELVNDDEMCLEHILELADSVTKAFVSQNLPFTVFYYSSNLKELRESYIGNEVERKQWFEMLLYDKCYRVDMIEEMFLKQNPSCEHYLYIGKGTQKENAEFVISGGQQTVAELRSK